MTRLFPLLLPLPVAACGYSATQFEADYIEVACIRASDCLTWSTLEEDWDVCVRDRRGEVSGLDAQTFDPARAHECLHTLATWDCDAGVDARAFPACQDVIWPDDELF